MPQLAPTCAHVLGLHRFVPQRFGPSPPQCSPSAHSPHSAMPSQPSGNLPHWAPRSAQVPGLHADASSAWEPLPSASPPQLVRNVDETVVARNPRSATQARFRAPRPCFGNRIILHDLSWNAQTEELLVVCSSQPAGACLDATCRGHVPAFSSLPRLRRDVCGARPSRPAAMVYVPARGTPHCCSDCKCGTGLLCTSGGSTLGGWFYVTALQASANAIPRTGRGNGPFNACNVYAGRGCHGPGFSPVPDPRLAHELASFLDFPRRSPHPVVGAPLDGPRAMPHVLLRPTEELARWRQSRR